MTTAGPHETSLPITAAPVQYDVVVIGGGVAGVMAAIAAQASGCRVLILEPSNVLGGQGTAGGVAGFCGDTVRVNAPFAELVARLASHDLIAPYRPNDDRRPYDLEWCAFYLQEMVAERAIDVLFHARVIAARRDQDRIDRVTVSAVGGLIEVSTQFVIDASGSCIVPWLTGFPVVHEGANRQLPMSLYFTLWDTGRPVQAVLPAGCPRWENDQEIPMTSLHRFPTGKVEVKMKVVGFDAADSFDRSAAEIFARRQMHALIYYLQTVGYGAHKLDSHVLAGVSRAIGVREERRIVGEHVLTEAEARSATVFSDAIAVNTYHIDYHWPDRMERAGTGITDMLEPHHLPLRMMIPQGAKNLLVPGRGASGDQTAMSAYRVMAVVAQMGFAAGHAARQCVQNGTDLSTLDLPALQAAIVQGGQSLDLSDYGDYLRRDRIAHELIGRGASAVCRSPCIMQGRNARFLVAWRDDSGGVWLTARIDAQWSPARCLANLGTGGALRLSFSQESGKGLMLSSSAADGTVQESVSSDDGASWSEFRRSPQARELGNLAIAALDDSRLVRATVGGPEQLVELAVSVDGGNAWSAPRAIDSQPGPCAEPGVTPTRTGLAMVLVGPEDQPFFWQGSIERILEGTPLKASHEHQLHN